MLQHFDGSMIVAMVAVRMMEAALHQVVEMIAVRYLFVAASFVLAVTSRWHTHIRIGAAHRQNVFVVVALVRGVQAAVVQVIDVPFVANARVAAVFAVNVFVVVVDFVAHASGPFEK
jgi:hypothetical protein